MAGLKYSIIPDIEALSAMIRIYPPTAGGVPGRIVLWRYVYIAVKFSDPIR